MTKKTASLEKPKENKSPEVSTVTIHQNSTEAGPHSLLRTIEEEPNKPNMKSTKKTQSANPTLMFVGALVIVLAGTVTGFGLSRAMGTGNGQQADTVTGIEQGTGKIADGQVSKGDILGNPEKSGDEAEGVLEKGGINGEGSHRLLRPGGPSQTVYLTSSVVDLDQLVGHKVKVWGETFSAQSAGWLMDVVTLEIVELNAPKPFEQD